MLTSLEGLALALVGVLELLDLDSSRVALALTTALFFALLAGGLGVCVRGLLRLQSWARGPVVAAQLIGLLLAYSFWGGDTMPVSIVLLVVPAATLVGIFHPTSTRALAAEDG